MWGARDEVGNLWLGGVNTFGAQALAIVPELLESDDPRVQKRLLPVTFDEDDEEEQWRKHGLPELARLFLSRSQLMRRDLESMRKVRDTDYWILCIPKGHESAWLSGLNGVRLALYELHDMEPAYLAAQQVD